MSSHETCTRSYSEFQFVITLAGVKDPFNPDMYDDMQSDVILKLDDVRKYPNSLRQTRFHIVVSTHVMVHVNLCMVDGFHPFYSVYPCYSVMNMADIFISS